MIGVHRNQNIQLAINQIIINETNHSDIKNILPFKI